jgi:hypothetical protein
MHITFSENLVHGECVESLYVLQNGSVKIWMGPTPPEFYQAIHFQSHRSSYISNTGVNCIMWSRSIERGLKYCAKYIYPPGTVSFDNGATRAPPRTGWLPLGMPSPALEIIVADSAHVAVRSLTCNKLT